MKKFLTFVLVLAMVLSVSSFAMAYTGTECDHNSCSHAASITSGGNTYGYDSLQEAIDDAQNGDTVILLKDCDEDVTVVQAPDVVITIDGNNKTVTMSGTITVDGKSQAYATAGLTIQNVKFDTTSISGDTCISLGVEGDNNTRYTSNVTVKGCTFTGSGEVVAAIRSHTGGCKNLTVIGCTVEAGMHSLLQIAGVAGVVVDNCTVNSKNGINLNSSTDVEIKKSNIAVKGYAVRIGAGSAGASGDVELTNNTLSTDNTEGDAVIVIRGAAVTEVDLDMTENVVSGNTHISGNTDETEISADANYWEGKAAPKTGSGSSVDVTSYYKDAEKNELAFSAGSVAKIGNVGYPSLNAAVAAANDGDTITLLANSSGDGIVFPEGKFGTNGLTIDFNSYTYTVSGKLVGSAGTETLGFQILKDNKVTLKNGKLDSSETAYKPSDYSTPCRMLVQNYTDLTLDNMVLDGSKCKEGLYTLSNNSGNVTIEDTEIIAPTNGFAFDVCKYASYDEPTVTVSGDSVINGKIEVTTTAQTNLQISGGKFSEEPEEEWLADGMKAEKGDGETMWGVVDEANTTPSAPPSNEPTASNKPSSGGGYYGPNVWYIGGNTFGTNTNQVPTSVEIDGVPVSFTMNGSQITVGCIQPGSGWVTVRWGSVSNYKSFTPDANAYCTQTVIPKTGGMSIWAAIAQFLGF